MDLESKIGLWRTKVTPKIIQNGYLAIAWYPLVKTEDPKLTPNQTLELGD